MKMLDIGGAGAAKIPLERRAAIERSLFGAQGGGGFALLADPAVNAQVKELRKTMESPEWKNQYGGFMEAYKGGSTVQQARTAMAEFNVTMMDLAKDTLPAVNNALGGFKSMLEGIRNLLPGGGTGKSAAVIGGHAILGAGAGAATGFAVGAFGGPIGMGAGALIGGVAGGVEGIAEQYMRQREHDLKEGGRDRVEEMFRPRLRLGGERSEAAPKVTTSPIALSLNIDGRTLAETIGTMLTKFGEFPTQAPAADGLGQHYGGDHNWGEK
jgi:hypothetical protein